MRFVLFTHSLVSDWNHGNAHFLRGVMRELVSRGHEAIAYEPAGGWSRKHLLAERGTTAIADFRKRFPELTTRTYGADPDLDRMLDNAHVVIVHEWTDPALVAAIGARRIAGGRFLLLFHDTHHRAVSAEADMAALDLRGYDAVLAFGEALSETYRRRGWSRRVFTWHEAADTRLFRPEPDAQPSRDLVWIGNWGDGERTAGLREYVVGPVRRLGLSATAFGVRYSAEAIAELAGAGIGYSGWIANAEVPQAFARHRVTVHVPRRPYVDRLPGIPTIRVFEALACGIPLVTASWRDEEALFRPGQDFLMANSGAEMERQLGRVLRDPELARGLRTSGLQRILGRHTCIHRVDELLAIIRRVRGSSVTVDRSAAE